MPLPIVAGIVGGVIGIVAIDGSTRKYNDNDYDYYDDYDDYDNYNNYSDYEKRRREKKRNLQIAKENFYNETLEIINNFLQAKDINCKIELQEYWNWTEVYDHLFNEVKDKLQSKNEKLRQEAINKCKDKIHEINKLIEKVNAIQLDVDSKE